MSAKHSYLTLSGSKKHPCTNVDHTQKRLHTKATQIRIRDIRLPVWFRIQVIISTSYSSYYLNKSEVMQNNTRPGSSLSNTVNCEVGATVVSDGFSIARLGLVSC